MTATRRDFLKALAALGASAYASALFGSPPAIATNIVTEEYGVATEPPTDPAAIEDAILKMKEYFECLKFPRDGMVVYLDKSHPLYEMACEIAEEDKSFTVEQPPWLAEDGAKVDP